MSDLSTTAARTGRLIAAASVRRFHQYANWLVGISWKRFFVLSLLLLIASGILSSVLPSRTSTAWENVPAPPARTDPRAAPTIEVRKGPPAGKDDDVTISIGKDGVRIAPRGRASPSAAERAASAPSAAAAATSAASAASSASSAAAPAAVAPTAVASAASASATSGPYSLAAGADGGVEIRLPPGATSEAVKAAVEEARAAVIEAINESRQAAKDAEEAASDAADASRRAERQYVRIRKTESGTDLPPLAMLFIMASAILKITYQGRIQAEVKAAAAPETAESEQLKRQVVEARMAAMQAQVEPHFLFNTLASIDHLIETDPPRASQMQKNLIALLRASMPTMREAHPAAHNLGHEMAVIRPYLEILKVRMEDRLQTEIAVPDGLLSAEIPSMMIQSLVENAIKHGLEPKPEGGTLTVRAEIVHGMLTVTVADTGLGFGKAATAGTGVGLANIRERLKLLYGGRAGVTVAENPPGGTRVTLTVPYQAQPREGDAA